MVIQRYVSRPLLLDGFKWDLRLYVLVTSFDPLEAFLYTEGFGRFASEPFSLERSRLQDPFVHLTNVSIQRRHPSERRDEPNADGCDGCDGAPPAHARRKRPPADPCGGTKCSLRSLFAKLTKERPEIEVGPLWAKVT